MNTTEAAKRIQSAYRKRQQKANRIKIAREAYLRFTGGGGYRAFHNILAGKSKNNNNKNRKLLGFLRHHPIMKTPRVYRNSPFLYRGLSSNNSKKFINNGEISSKSFQSFSKRRLVAQGYAKGEPPVIIVLPANKFPHVVSGKYGFLSKFTFENEVTLPPGKFINTGNKTKNGNYLVRATY